MLRRILLLHAVIFAAAVSGAAQTASPTPTSEPMVSPAPSVEPQIVVSPTPETTKIVVAAPLKLQPAPPRVGVNPADTITLSLNDAIRRALENNNDIEVARNDVRLNETNLRSLEGFFDPRFTITPQIVRNAQIGQPATTNFTASSNFFQNITRGGGNYSVFLNSDRREALFGSGAQAVLNQGGGSGGAFYSSTLGFSFNQPLFRNRNIDNNRRQIKIQRKRLEQSDADFRRRSIETIANVQRAYWNLVFALRDQQNRRENLRLTEENMRRVEAQIQAGVAAPLARAEVATEMANRETDLLNAAQNVTTAENTLKQLLLKEAEAAEWRSPIVPTDEPSFDQPPVNLEDALKDATANRPELQRLKLEREVNEIDLRFAKNQIKPRIDLTAQVFQLGFSQTVNPVLPAGTLAPIIVGNPDTTANAFLLQQINVLRQAQGLTPVTTPFIPVTGANANATGSFNRSFLNLFRSDATNFQVGVTIEFPFRNQTAKADLAAAQIQQNQIGAQTRIQEQTVVSEVRNSVQAVETARRRIETAQAARANAEIQLQGEQKLFEAGRSTTFLLFQRENALANARNAEIRAQTDYNIALADLQRATSTTLRANNVLVESLIAP